MSSLQETIGDARWVEANYKKLKELFPEESTRVDIEFMMRVGFRLKVLGVDWRSEDELVQVLMLCGHLGVYEQQRAGTVMWVHRSKHETPPAAFFSMSHEQVRVNRLLNATPDAATVQAADTVIARFRRPPTP